MKISEAKYLTRYGDTVDYICWRHYGSERGGTTEAVLNANIGLAAHGPVLPAGLTIVLPAYDDTQQVEKMIELWD